jgi:macrolide-specific efflux system membrane fusion protein
MSTIPSPQATQAQGATSITGHSTSRPKRSWMIWTLGIGLVVAAGIGVWSWRQSLTPPTEQREFTIQRGDLELTILSTGSVQPENRLEIKPPIPGRIETVLVKEGARVQKGQILAWMSSTERAALLDSARAKGPEELKRWEDLYRATPVMAPISGMIIRRNVESGQTFASTDAILVMSNRLTVKAQVDETDIAKIKLHQPATLVLDAYPTQKIPAHVDQIAFEAKTVSNVTTYVVDVLPEQTPETMRSGMTANVTFLISSKKNILLLPVEAIRTERGKSYAMVKKSQDSKPTEVTLELGESDGRRTEVLSGLQEGDRVLSLQQLGPRKGQSSGSSPFAPRLGGSARRSH